MKRILVLDGNTRAALAVIEGFIKEGYEVDIASYTPFCKGSFVKGVRSRHLYDYSTPTAFKESIIKILKRTKYDLVVPATDQTSYHLVNFKKELQKYATITPLVDRETFTKAFDKNIKLKICRAEGIPIPPTVFPDEPGFKENVHRLGLPVIVKLAKSQGGMGSRIFHTRSELESFLKKEKDVSAYLFQKRIAFTERIDVGLILDHNQKVIASLVWTIPRIYPIHTGTSGVVVSVKDPEALRIAKRFARTIRWIGVANVQFMRDAEGKLYFLEMNPRFWASGRIALITGLNFADMVYRVAKGLKVNPAHDYPTGIHLRYLPNDLRWFVRSPDRFKHRDFWRFFHPDTHYTIMQRKNPGLFIGFIAEVVFNWPRWIANRIAKKNSQKRGGVRS
ncbi:ATP-grasp domain-containing protein [Candidatus Woesearchaeota archaeon]|nr:ATP-grasp domain-containing protein [Candidatus Woesearchaeota archaeon]